MKLVILTLVLSGQALAQTCFTRPVELQTNKVELPQVICVESVDLELDYFGESKGKVSIVADGKKSVQDFSLNKGSLRADGSRMYSVHLGASWYGMSCSEYWRSLAKATIIIGKDLKTTSVAGIKGELYFSWDQCHSETVLKQSFDYIKE